MNDLDYQIRRNTSLNTRLANKKNAENSLLEASNMEAAYGQNLTNFAIEKEINNSMSLQILESESFMLILNKLIKENKLNEEDIIKKYEEIYSGELKNIFTDYDVKIHDDIIKIKYKTFSTAKNLELLKKFNLRNDIDLDKKWLSSFYNTNIEEMKLESIELNVKTNSDLKRIHYGMLGLFSSDENKVDYCVNYILTFVFKALSESINNISIKDKNRLAEFFHACELTLNPKQNNIINSFTKLSIFYNKRMSCSKELVNNDLKELMAYFIDENVKKLEMNPTIVIEMINDESLNSREKIIDFILQINNNFKNTALESYNDKIKSNVDTFNDIEIINNIFDNRLLQWKLSLDKKPK